MSPPNVRELFPEKQHNIRQWLWRQRLEKRYWPYAGMVGEGTGLHFVLGLAGGGGEHLMRLLTQKGVAVRGYKGLLQRFEPRLDFGAGEDRLAVEYAKDMPFDHPLLRVYRMLMEFDNDWTSQHLSNRPETGDLESLPCLVGETHALLGTEALLRGLGAKALLYVGDPVRMVDSLFAQWGEESTYLLAEGRNMLAPQFLSRFYRRDFRKVLEAHKRIRRLSDPRQRNIAHRVLVAGLMEHMFRMLAARYPRQVQLVEFGQLVDNPYYLEDSLRNFLGDPGLQIARTVTLLSTFKPENRNHLVWHNSWPEQMSYPRYLTESELRLCRELLHLSGLGPMYRPAEQEQSAGVVQRLVGKTSA